LRLVTNFQFPDDDIGIKDRETGRAKMYLVKSALARAIRPGKEHQVRLSSASFSSGSLFGRDKFALDHGTRDLGPVRLVLKQDSGAIRFGPIKWTFFARQKREGLLLTGGRTAPSENTPEIDRSVRAFYLTLAGDGQDLFQRTA
jgi:hypothetical protein